MKNKILPITMIVLALGAALILGYFGFVYESTKFYSLGEGEGHYTPVELLFVPESGEGDGLYVASSGELRTAKRLSRKISFGEGWQMVDYYLYGDAIFPMGKGYLNWYAANSAESFIVVLQDRKYLANITTNEIRPLFAGSTYFNEYAKGMDGISSDGGYCAGIREGELTILTLQKGNFAPIDKKVVNLDEENIQDARFIRYVNGVHLWFSGLRDGVERQFVCDSSTGEIALCPEAPAGYSAELHSRVWRLGSGVVSEDSGDSQLVVGFFNVISGEIRQARVSSKEFSAAEPAAISPGGVYAVLRLNRGGEWIWGVYKFADGKLTLMDAQPESVYFASDKALFCNLADGYQVVNIVH